MRIALITNNLPPIVDGVGDYTLNLAREFAKNGNSVAIICRLDTAICTNYDWVRVYPCVQSWDIGVCETITHIIRQERCDVAILQYVPHGFHPKGLPFGLVDVVRCINRLEVELFTFAHEVYVKPKRWRIRRNVASIMMQWITRAILLRSKHIATSTPHYREMIEGLLPHHNRRVELIPIASNVPHTPLACEELAALRSTIARSNELIVSFFGVRDIGSSVEAIELLRGSGIAIKPLIIGKSSASLPPEFANASYQTGILRIEEIDRYLQLSDMMILPEGSSEGVSFKSGSLAAALQCGLPVVSARGSMTDERLRDGENIIFTNFGSSAAVARSIRRLTDPTLRRTIGAGAAVVGASLNWSSTYRLYIETIKRVNTSPWRVILSHPTGNSNLRGVADGLLSHSLLHSFHTSVASFGDNIFGTLSKFRPLRDLSRRQFNPSLRHLTHLYPWRELGRMLCRKVGLNYPTRHEVGRFSVDALYRSVDNNVARYVRRCRERISALYCYEDCAESTFEAAKPCGALCLYDLPIGYWRAMHRVLDGERAARPEWAMTLGGLNDSDQKLARKDRELSFADKIYVASSFTKSTLAEYPGTLAPIEVIPYGFPDVRSCRHYKPYAGRPIRLLYVGSLTQRKGIANIFEALESLHSRVELSIIGSGDTEGCDALRRSLAGVRHIESLPHSEVLEEMASHDLLLFPSLFEGFGLVVTESMSQGTPVITTDRTCGRDLITHGVDGWIVEAGSTHSLRHQIEELLVSPERIEAAGRAAMKTAAGRPWSHYGDEIAESVCHLISESYD
ncbi:MAG: glycosyltransferase family 4 protein [Rikenellaceae bacterium]